MTTWTRVANPETDTALLPAWFAVRMTGARGSFGLLLATGDVLRVASVVAAHLSAEGTVLVDVLLDHAGVPESADTAWRSKHYLGAPVPGAVMATVNLAQVVAAVEFTPGAAADPPSAQTSAADAVADLREAAEAAADRGTVD